MRALAILALALAPAVLAFSNVNQNVNFQFIPATSTTPGGYFDVCPLNSYVERNPAVGPMNITECGCPDGYTLRPTARSEGTSAGAVPGLGGGLQCRKNDELPCVDCEYYVSQTAAQKIDALWDHIMTSVMVNGSQLCGTKSTDTIKTCVYKSSLLNATGGAHLPQDSVEFREESSHWGKGREGRDTFPRFTSLYTESMDASFDRYADVLPKGRVKAIHNHGVVAKVHFTVNTSAMFLDEITNTLKKGSGFLEKGSQNCLLRSSISHPINITCDGCANNGFLASTALKCTRNGTYSANILGLQDARGQGANMNFYHTQLKNWVPSYNPALKNFGGVGPNAERFGTSTDDPLRMALDQFSVAGEAGEENIEGISQPEILYWVPNGCRASESKTPDGLRMQANESCTPFKPGQKPADNQANWITTHVEPHAHKSVFDYDFRDSLMQTPPGTILYDLYAPSSRSGSCYCTNITTDTPLYNWSIPVNGKYVTEIATGGKNPCPVILNKTAGCDPDAFPFVKIGQLVTAGPTVMSGWSDSQLFFQHARYAKRENRVCRFEEAIANNNKGVVHPARFSADHHLACVAGEACPAGSTEVKMTQSLPSGHPSVKGSVAPSVGCPFANALNTRLVGEAYPRPLPPGNCPDGTLSGKTELGKHSYTCEQFRCPANSFATRLNPISFVHCECDVGYSADCESSPEGKCECMPTGPYTSYNPVGLRGFWGFEISVPQGSLSSAVDFWSSKFGFQATYEGAGMAQTLPNGKQMTTQLMRLPYGSDGGAIAIELTEMEDSQAPKQGGYYGYDRVSFSVADAEASYKALQGRGVSITAQPAMQSDLGYTFFEFTDPQGNIFNVVQDHFGGKVGANTFKSSFWDTQNIPAQPAMTTVAISAANPVGLGGIRSVHEVVPETSAAQIWQQETLGMLLWQFEKPELVGLAENFNDCYQNSQLREGVDKGKCAAAARLFPSATVGLGNMRVVYKYEGSAYAGFVNQAESQGSFIRPPPPYQNAYHGVSHVSYQVPILQYSMQALDASEIERIAPHSVAGDKGYRGVYFATNSKAYVKLVQPNTDALSSVPGPDPYNRLASNTTLPAAPSGGSDDGHYRQATIALAVLFALGCASAGAVMLARRNTAGTAYQQHQSRMSAADARAASDVQVEMRTASSAGATTNPAYDVTAEGQRARATS